MHLPYSVSSVFDAVNSPATAPIIDPSVTLWTPDRLPIAVGTRITAIHSFEPEGEGTQYTWRLEFERSVLPSVLIRWLAGRFERAIAAQHSALRAHLAATQPS